MEEGKCAPGPISAVRIRGWVSSGGVVSSHRGQTASEGALLIFRQLQTEHNTSEINDSKGLKILKMSFQMKKIKDTLVT